MKILRSTAQRSVIESAGISWLALCVITVFFATPILADVTTPVTVHLNGTSRWYDSRLSAMAEIQQRLFDQLENHCHQLNQVADLTSLEPTNPLYMFTRYTQDNQKQYRINLPDATGLCIKQET